MNPDYDWLNDLTGGCEDITAIAKTPRTFISKKTALSFLKGSCAALALPLYTFSAFSEHPVIKSVPHFRDTMILSTNVSTISPSPVIEAQTYYTTTGDKVLSGWW
ncbi:MAG: hypothetical protein KC643_30210 [Nitrospira sp.]|nr:hypothetical protein [Nitrospira sp.]